MYETEESEGLPVTTTVLGDMLFSYMSVDEQMDVESQKWKTEDCSVEV